MLSPLSPPHFTSQGQVYAFGQGLSGQLGIKNPHNCNLPQMVVGPWVTPSGTSLPQETDDTVPKIYVQKVSMETASRLYSELIFLVVTTNLATPLITMMD